MGEVSTFFAAGIPQSKGSMRAFYIEKLGRSVITDSNKKAKTWQGVISTAAMEAGTDMLNGDVYVVATFIIPRPKSHYGTGKNADLIKDRFLNTKPAKKPDIDKLSRCVLDALTGILYADDAKVTTLVAKKRWIGWQGISTAGVRVETGPDR